MEIGFKPMFNQIKEYRGLFNEREIEILHKKDEKEKEMTKLYNNKEYLDLILKHQEIDKKHEESKTIEERIDLNRFNMKLWEEYLKYESLNIPADLVIPENSALKLKEIFQREKVYCALFIKEKG
jgi:hypothetical protein